MESILSVRQISEMKKKQEATDHLKNENTFYLFWAAMQTMKVAK